jgi:hypothetical protein
MKVWILVSWLPTLPGDPFICCLNNRMPATPSLLSKRRWRRHLARSRKSRWSLLTEKEKAMVHHIPLDMIEPHHLERLVKDQTVENYRLEFKRSIEVDNERQKHELAKDASALANTAGGRIVFGIEERTLADGTKCAGELTGVEIADEEAILNIIATRTAPPISARLRSVALPTGNRVFVLEVYSSIGADLHQVTGKSGGRFYRRDDKGVRQMAEPEIREAFLGILAVQNDLDSRLSSRRQLLYGDRPETEVEEIITVVPWFAREDQVRPQDFEETLLHRVKHASLILRGQLDTTWYRVDGEGVYLPAVDSKLSPEVFLRIAKDGSVALSDKNVVAPSHSMSVYYPLHSLRLILGAILIAREVQAATNYYGPSEIAHRILVPGTVAVGSGVAMHFPGDGSYLRRIREFRVLQGQPIVAARQLMDEALHLAGERNCYLFDEEGHLADEAAKFGKFLLP